MSRSQQAIARLWHQGIALGFRLLYNELASLYDPVSWAVSLGRWRRWQLTAIPFLKPESCVLEVGFGPGHLLVDLAAAGHRPFGIDPSKSMLRLARKNARTRAITAPICRGLAETLPFAPKSFDAVIATFPTSYVYDPAWCEQVIRVLKGDGRLVIVEWATFNTGTPLSQPVEWLFEITGQRAPAPDLVGLLRQAGLQAWRESVAVEGSVVGLVVAQKHSEAPA